MAKQTIIVMSDSHGDRAIVEEIRNHYIGKVDAIFHNGDSELPSDDEVWQGIQVVAGNMDFYDGYPERLVTDLAGTIIAQTHGHLFHINFSFQKLDLWAQEVNLPLWSPAYPRCSNGGQNALSESGLHQPATRPDQRTSLR